jgi:dihydroorotate dehydrogenase electron transfer subunit
MAHPLHSNATVASARIVAHQQVGPAHFSLAVSLPPEAPAPRPGQFYLVRVASGFDPLLRRPLSASQYDPQAHVLGLLYRVTGKGTARLSEFAPGGVLDLLGPQGQPFHVPEGLKQALLIAGGIGVAPFPFLAAELTRLKPAPKVTLLFGARTAAELLCLEEFAAAGCAVELCTDDGSRGRHGFVTVLLEEALASGAAAEGLRQAYACGPEPMMRKAAALCRKAKLPLQVSLERRMACGMGSCLGCVVSMRHGPVAETAFADYRRVCVDGPVFDAEELPWNDGSGS